MIDVLSERYLLRPHCELFVAMALALLMHSAGILCAMLAARMEPILPSGPAAALVTPGHRLARGGIR